MKPNDTCPVCGSGATDCTWDVTPDGLPVISDGEKVMHFWCYDCNSDWLANEFNQRPYVKQSHVDRYLANKAND